MANDEALREALLELHILREREAKVLAESRTLIDCLEAYSLAASAGEALASIFVSLAQKFGASLSFLAAPQETGVIEIVAASDQTLLDQVLHLPFDLFERPRNLSDLHVFDDLPEVLKPFGAAIVVPVRGDLALMTLRPVGEQFKRTDIDVVQRLAGLAVQAQRDSLLAARNDLLAASISGSSSGFAIADAQRSDRPLLYVNAAFERLSGYTAEEVLGQNCRFLTDEAEEAPERQRLRKAVAENAPGTFLLRNKRKGGERFWNELTLFPVKDAKGVVKNLVATQSDVTDRIKAAEDRDKIRGWMQSALTATDDAFLVLDRDNRIALANRSVAKLFPAGALNWDVGTAFQDNWQEYLTGCEDLPGRVTTLLRQAVLTDLVDRPGGFELHLPDGLTVLVRANSLTDGGMVISATDVTAMKSAQSLLTQRLSAIEAASNGIATADPNGRLTFVNSAGAQLLGFESSTAALGHKWRSRYREEDAELGDGKMTQLKRQNSKDGPVFTHEVSLTDLEAGGSVIVIRDETDRLAREAREDALEADLVRLQRQEAIAQLTAGIAHDFNNLLSIINGSATLAELDAALPDSIKPHIGRILTAGTQASRLISRLLDVGAADDQDSTFDLALVLSDLPQLVRAGLRSGQSFDVSGKLGTRHLRGEANALSQILINLALNARDALDDGPGDIRLEVRNAPESPGIPIVVGELKARTDYVMLSVSDSGSGMTADTAASIFEPYFTTKADKGTGLGLATAALQVRTVGGAIGLTSTPGEGTTFSIFWPLVPDEDQGADAGARLEYDLSGMTVLLVDDDPDVSNVLANFLSLQGAEVAQCQDPRDAIDAIRDDPTAWSVLITDYDMPIMNGGALVAKVRPCAPDLPILVVTALAKRLSDRRLSDHRVDAILSKAAPLSQLAERLAKIREG